MMEIMEIMEMEIVMLYDDSLYGVVSNILHDVASMSILSLLYSYSMPSRVAFLYYYTGRLLHETIYLY
jgi:hypothetical protein